MSFSGNEPIFFFCRHWILSALEHKESITTSDQQISRFTRSLTFLGWPSAPGYQSPIQTGVHGNKKALKRLCSTMDGLWAALPQNAWSGQITRQENLIHRKYNRDMRSKIHRLPRPLKFDHAIRRSPKSCSDLRTCVDLQLVHPDLQTDSDFIRFYGVTAISLLILLKSALSSWEFARNSKYMRLRISSTNIRVNFCVNRHLGEELEFMNAVDSRTELYCKLEMEDGN
ncbi:hypothetical protein T265_05666 [Opisthorchis viverrini]|uniref:Uncharacterized protein n=1 Tax=Opisthorchis viverrini TaxID=6198 RepID=A0A074ZIV9_OPIVI|nr:hypothetical protein T265_05666 [Opisthorchis viverrini]KER27263.1 hypothetical protein T265_05666 [Opisthorchis viverrini]